MAWMAPSMPASKPAHNLSIPQSSLVSPPAMRIVDLATNWCQGSTIPIGRMPWHLSSAMRCPAMKPDRQSIAERSWPANPLNQQLPATRCDWLYQIGAAIAAMSEHPYLLARRHRTGIRLRLLSNLQ
jgi:hypothetical protein